MKIKQRVRESLQKLGVWDAVKFVMPKHHRPMLRVGLARAKASLRPSGANIGKLARLYADLQQYQLALPLCNSAISLDPSCADAYASRGMILASLGTRAEAIADLSRALELRPGQADIHATLADLLFKDFDLDAAMRHYDKALTLDPNARWPTGEAIRSGDDLFIASRYMDNYASQANSTKTVALLRTATVHLEASLRQGETLEAWEKLLWCYPLAGRWKDFTRTLGRIFALKEQDPKFVEFQKAGPDVEFLPDFCAQAIGAIGWLTTHVKKKIMLGTGERLILCAPEGRSVNKAFLSYFKPYVDILESPEEIAAVSARKALSEMPLGWGMRFDAAPRFLGAAVSEVHKRWAADSRPPLLTLSDHDIARGKDMLRKIGLPDGAWWVAVHARTSSFYKDRGSEAFRNADIESYFNAFKSITDRGGWVFRMGDPAMPPLPALEHVIDYAHSDFRSDWMDVYLASQCRFYIGTQSGLSAIPNSFGTASLQTNNLPMLCTAYLPDDVVVPKLVKATDGHLLTFREMLEEPYVGAATQFLYDDLGATVVSNSPEDIRRAVEDMLANFDANGVRRSAPPTELQRRFDALVEAAGLSLSGRIDADFLERHRDLL